MVEQKKKKTKRRKRPKDQKTSNLTIVDDQLTDDTDQAPMH